MKTIIYILVACSCHTLFAQHNGLNLSDSVNYMKKRDGLLHDEDSLSFSRGIKLSDAEKKIDSDLTRMKREITFSLAENFYDVKDRIERSALFTFLQKLPKGGVLHLHTKATTSAEWMVETLSEMEDCYVYWDGPEKKRHGEIIFAKKKPAHSQEGSYFKKDTLARKELIALLTLGPEDKSNIWDEFINCFNRAKGFVTYEPLFKAYYMKGMKELIEDNVQYVELRAGVSSKFYTLDKKPFFDPARNVKYLMEVRDELRLTYPHFDMKLIYAAQRSEPKDTVLKELERAYQFNSRKEYKRFVIGFDLIGEEDKGHTTLYYLPVWLQQQSLAKKYGIEPLPLYLHDGESNLITNRNLFDAVALNSRRIGHGFNLHYFPSLQQKIKEQRASVEICPISNQVLGYVHDLRNHPGADFLKNGVEAVLSNDDPGVFHYKGLTYDLWAAVVAWDLNLADIKQLCLNSLEKSAMNAEELAAAKSRWQCTWESFVTKTDLKCDQVTASVGSAK